MVQEGTLSPSDLVWKEGMPEWRPAGDSRSLFPRASRHPVPAERVREAEAPDAAVAGWEQRKPLFFGAAAAALLTAVVGGVALLGWRGTDGPEPPPPQAAPATPAPETTPAPEAALAAEPAGGPVAVTAPAVADAAGAKTDATPAPEPTAAPVEQPPACLAPLAAWPFPEAAAQRLPHAIRLSPDGGTLAVGLDDGRLALFDVAGEGRCRLTEPARPPVASMPAATDPACSIAFADSGRSVAWGTRLCHFAIASLDDGAVTWRPPLDGLAGKAGSVSVALRDDETMLVATPAGISELSTIDVCRPLNGMSPWNEAVDRGPGGSFGMTFVPHVGAGPLGRGPGFWPADPRAATQVALGADGSSAAVIGSGGDPTLTFLTLGAGRTTARSIGLADADVRAGLLLAVGDSAAIVATPARILLLTAAGREKEWGADLPARATPASIGMAANRRCVVLGRSDGTVLILAFPADRESATVPIDRLALDGSGPAHAAITPDGSRIFTTRGERIVVWSLDAAKVGPPPAAPPPETTRSE